MGVVIIYECLLTAKLFPCHTLVHAILVHANLMALYFHPKKIPFHFLPYMYGSLLHICSCIFLLFQTCVQGIHKDCIQVGKTTANLIHDSVAFKQSGVLRDSCISSCIWLRVQHPQNTDLHLTCFTKGNTISGWWQTFCGLSLNFVFLMLWGAL